MYKKKRRSHNRNQKRKRLIDTGKGRNQVCINRRRIHINRNKDKGNMQKINSKSGMMQDIKCSPEER